MSIAVYGGSPNTCLVSMEPKRLPLEPCVLKHHSVESQDFPRWNRKGNPTISILELGWVPGHRPTEPEHHHGIIVDSHNISVENQMTND